MLDPTMPPADHNDDIASVDWAKFLKASGTDPNVTTNTNNFSATNNESPRFLSPEEYARLYSTPMLLKTVDPSTKKESLTPIVVTEAFKNPTKYLESLIKEFDHAIRTTIGPHYKITINSDGGYYDTTISYKFENIVKYYTREDGITITGQIERDSKIVHDD